MPRNVMALLRAEVEGPHGESERRAAAQFVADALGGPGATAEEAAGLAESLAEASLGLARRLRGPAADPVGRLSLADLRGLARRVVQALYGDGPDTQWSPETLDDLAAALDRYGLVPAAEEG
jgi:hypothetical protein